MPKYCIEVRHNGRWVLDGSLLVNLFDNECEALDVAEDLAKDLASELDTDIETQMKLMRVVVVED